MSYKTEKSKTRYFFILFFLCLLPSLATAQMFSADNSSSKQELIPRFAIYGGIEPINFEYQGNNDVPGGGGYAFNGPIIRFLLETPGVNIFLGTGGKLTGLHDGSYFDGGIKVGYGLPLYHSKNALLLFPFQLQATYTNVTNDEVLTTNMQQFHQGTFAVGAGIDFNAKLARRLRIKASIIPSYGFSFSTREQNSGGSIFAAEGKARIYFDHLFGSAGLSLGYGYRFRQYNIKGQILDYNATGNSFLIGITF